MIMCDCFDTVGATLEKDNERFVSLLSFDTGNVLKRALITIEKVNPKKRPGLRKLVATFCPFCGEKYEEPKKRAAKPKG
jgi:hypothetical protein